MVTNYLMPIYEKLLLRKRFIIETVIGVLKEQMGMVHTRHRSVENAFVHIISCLVAYCFSKKQTQNQKCKVQISDHLNIIRVNHEAHAREQITGVPLDLGDDAAGLLP